MGAIRKILNVNAVNRTNVERHLGEYSYYWRLQKLEGGGGMASAVARAYNGVCGLSAVQGQS